MGATRSPRTGTASVACSPASPAKSPSAVPIRTSSRAARTELLDNWGEALRKLAKGHYDPHFKHYSTQPKTMPFAHRAVQRFYGMLKKITQAFAKPADAS